jgi:hypothetical protein
MSLILLEGLEITLLCVRAGCSLRAGATKLKLGMSKSFVLCLRHFKFLSIYNVQSARFHDLIKNCGPREEWKRARPLPS